MDCSLPGSSVYGFSRQEYWSGLPFPTSGNCPSLGTEPASRVSPALAGGFFTINATWEAHILDSSPAKHLLQMFSSSLWLVFSFPHIIFHRVEVFILFKSSLFFLSFMPIFCI